MKYGAVYTWILATSLPLMAVAPALAQPNGVYPRLLCDNNPPTPEDCTTAGLDNPFQNLRMGTPFQAQLSPNLQHLYVVNNFGDNYSILSVGTPSEVSPLKEVNLDQDCFAVDLAIAADKLFVGCFGPDLLGARTEEGRLEVFTKNQLGTYEVRGPRIELDPDPGVPDTEPFTSVTGITSSADGKFLYVAMIQEDSCGGPFRFRFGSVAVVRTDNYLVSDQFPHTSTCGRTGNQELLEPLDIVRSPDGRKLYVSLHSSTPPDVAVLNVSQDGSAIPGSSYEHIQLCLTSGCNDPSDEDAKDPAALLLSPDGSKLYVTHNGLTGTPRYRISVVNTASKTVTKRINLPSSGSEFIDYNPTLPVYTSDLTKILVPLYGDNDNPGDHVAVINAATDTLDLTATIPIPRSQSFDGGPLQTAQPIAIVVNPAQPFAYVVNNVPDTIAVLRTVPPPVPELGPLALFAALALVGIRLHRRKNQGVGSRA